MIFTKVPGIYRTREGGYAYVKFIQDGVVIGCKARLRPDMTVHWESNIMQEYGMDGRCVPDKDQAEDIVAYDSSRVVLVFRPGIPEHNFPVLCRLLGKYQILHRNMDRWWKTNGESWNFPSDDLEWAELP